MRGGGGRSPRTVSSLLTSRRADSHLELLLVRAVTDLRVMRSVHAEPRALLFVWEEKGEAAARCAASRLIASAKAGRGGEGGVRWPTGTEVFLLFEALKR